MSKIDFKTINEKAIDSAEKVVSNWVPNGSRNGNEWIALNPTRNDSSKGSFSINLLTGIWKDFATNDAGADLISLVAYVEKVNQGSAARSLSKFLGITDSANSSTEQKPVTNRKAEFKPIYKPPLEAGRKCPLVHPRNGAPTKYWDYRSQDGSLIIRVMRFDSNKKGQRNKDYRPLAFGTLGNGKPQWHWRQLPQNRPLYRLDCLNQASNKVAVICEGEKAADSAIELFPDCFVTCWAGGSKAITKTDFSPLRGQQIIFWPDNDTAGKEATSILKEQLAKVGIDYLHVINTQFFVEYSPGDNGSLQPGGSWPEKADAFEALQLGWRAEHLSNAMKNNLLFDDEEIPLPEEADFIPHGFTLNEQGLWYTDDKSNSKKICSPIEYVARSRSGLGDGRNWGMLLKFKDHDSQEKLWNVSMQEFATDGGNPIVKGLLERGLNITPYRDAKRKLLEYLHGYDTKRRVSLVYKMGWHKNAFVFPETVAGSDEQIMYYSESPAMCKLGESGSLEEWQTNVSQYCSGNSLALFAVSAALSAPLVELMGYESMGFHFYGDSSWGKSTLLNVACSVFGDPEKYKCTFRATDNALESLASAHSDMLLALDEINQVDARIIGDIIYMLGNGQGKHRANDRGQARESQHRWKLTYLTNGEKTLEQYLLEGGKKVTGGMEMRFLGIRATFHESEAERKHKGVFNNCHNFAGGAELSNHLKRNMQKYYGTAFPAFIYKLVEKDFKTLTSYLVNSIDKFVLNYLTPEAGGQVQRAAAKFALVGLAGELATQWNITGWQKGEAYNASIECFQSWLKSRGGEGNMEDKQLLQSFRMQLEMHGDSHFKRWDSESPSIDTHVPSPSESWGFRRHIDKKDPVHGESQDVIYYIHPTVFKEVICKGNDHQRLARLLRDIGALMLRDGELKENRLMTKERLPGTGRKMKYIYKVQGSVLFGDSD